MTAGLNLKADIWVFTNSNDDSVGGARPSGTIVYRNAELRVSPLKPTQALLEQGLGNARLYTSIISPTYNPTGTFVLNENYQLQITYPPISEHYMKFFVVIGQQPATMNDSRKYWLATLRRLEQANSNTLQ